MDKRKQEIFPKKKERKKKTDIDFNEINIGHRIGDKKENKDKIEKFYQEKKIDREIKENGIYQLELKGKNFIFFPITKARHNRETKGRGIKDKTENLLK